ncbi:hypothetical protein [Algoriphagus namhaensis]
MKKTVHYLFVSLLASLIISCSSEEKVEQTEELSFEWEFVDSLDFEYLGNPILADIHMAGDKALFYDFASANILITDLKGNLVSEFNKTEDTPDSYGFMMNLPGFFKADQISVMGMAGIFLYDLEGNMITRVKHPESIGGAAFMAMAGKSMEKINLGGKDYILSKSVRGRDSYPGETRFYDLYRALELVDPDSGESTEMIPFEDGTLFKNGLGYWESDYMPAFEAKDEKIYIAMGGEGILRVYEMENGQAVLDTAIQLTIPNFQPIEGNDLSTFEKGSITIEGGVSSIRNIHIVDGKLVLPYYAGMDPKKSEELEQLWMSGAEEEAELAYEQAEREIPKGALIFDLETLAYLGRLAMPEKAPSPAFASSGDFLWMEKPASEEVEEDFVRIYQVKVVQK